MPVSGLLRGSGRVERFTRTGRVRDVAEIRAARVERARRERAEALAAWELLATDGPVRLSSFARLDHDVFERLLDLLGRALSTAAGSDGTRRGATADGRMEIVLSPPPPGASPAVLRTPRGRLEGPDYTVDIRGIAVRRAARGTDRRAAS